MDDSGYVVAAIRRAVEIVGEPWHWAWFGDALGAGGQGMAKSLDEGKAALAAAYRAWLAREGKDEATTSPATRTASRLTQVQRLQLGLPIE